MSEISVLNAVLEVEEFKKELNISGGVTIEDIQEKIGGEPENIYYKVLSLSKKKILDRQKKKILRQNQSNFYYSSNKDTKKMMNQLIKK